MDSIPSLDGQNPTNFPPKLIGSSIDIHLPDEDWNLFKHECTENEFFDIDSFLLDLPAFNEDDQSQYFDNNISYHTPDQPGENSSVEWNKDDFQAPKKYENQSDPSVASKEESTNSSYIGQPIKKFAPDKNSSIAPEPRSNSHKFREKTSNYRGVTRHRWTRNYEAHIWDKSSKREGTSRKGRQIYLGSYEKEEKAARAYDLAALKYWGTTTPTNFLLKTYEKELDEMKTMTRQEFVASLRRNSNGFSKGQSAYRGVTRQNSSRERWQARLGRVGASKDLYLGSFATEEEAAKAYDIAKIKLSGSKALTNFNIDSYDVEGIMRSDSLPIAAGAMKKIKERQELERINKEKRMKDLHSSNQGLMNIGSSSSVMIINEGSDNGFNQGFVSGNGGFIS